MTDALDDAIRDVFSEDGLVTQWVVVAATDDGMRPSLTVHTSDDLMPWHRAGMLYDALHMVYEDDEDEEPEEDA